MSGRTEWKRDGLTSLLPGWLDGPGLSGRWFTREATRRAASQKGGVKLPHAPI